MLEFWFQFFRGSNGNVCLWCISQHSNSVSFVRKIDSTFEMNSNSKLADALQGFLDKHDQDIPDGNSCLEKLKSRSDVTIPKDSAG